MIKIELTFFLVDCPLNLYFFVLSFSFLSSDSLRRITTTCAYNTFYIAIFPELLWIQMVGSKVHLDYFYIGLKILLKMFLLPQKMNYQQLRILVPNFIIIIGNIFNVYIHCFLRFQSLMLLLYLNNCVVFVSCDWYLFLVCFCRVLFLALSTRSETNQKKVPIAWLGILFNIIHL